MQNLKTELQKQILIFQKISDTTDFENGAVEVLLESMQQLQAEIEIYEKTENDATN